MWTTYIATYMHKHKYSDFLVVLISVGLAQARPNYYSWLYVIHDNIIEYKFHVHAGRQLHQLYGLKYLIFMLAPRAKCSLIHRFDVSDVHRKSVYPMCVYEVYAHTTHVFVGSCLATKVFIGNLPAMGRGWVIIK